MYFLLLLFPQFFLSSPLGLLQIEPAVAGFGAVLQHRSVCVLSCNKEEQEVVNRWQKHVKTIRKLSMYTICETKWPFSRFPSKHGLFAVVLYFLLMFVLCLKLFLCSLHPKASGSMVRHYGFSPLVSTIFYISPPHLLNCLTAYTAYA